MTTNQPPASWKRVSEELMFHTPVMDIVRRKYKLPDASAERDFYVLDSPDWANVIPVTAQGTVILAHQYRVGLEAATLEMPGGISDPADKTPQATALRELAEETGYTLVSGGRVNEIGFVHPNPAIMNNRAHVYVAGPVAPTQGQNLDTGERISLYEVPIERLPAMIASGEITHTIMISALGMLLLQNPGRTLPEILREYVQTRQ